MNFNEYQKLAFTTAPKLMDTHVMATLGLGGETGEVIELIKKAEYHKIPLERDKMVKELGDVLWYLAVLAGALTIDLQDVAEANVAKLKQRYPNGFVEGGGIRNEKLN